MKRLLPVLALVAASALRRRRAMFIAFKVVVLWWSGSAWTIGPIRYTILHRLATTAAGAIDTRGEK